uniref:Uncharacterized protein n=1 Tax=Anguilla anguilla TaxID=7936 RepID=A0A0E9V4H1_ANGAN
MGHTCHNPS